MTLLGRIVFAICYIILISSQSRADTSILCGNSIIPGESSAFVYILEPAILGNTEKHRSTARKLARLVQMDTLLHDSLAGLAVILLKQPDNQRCEISDVEHRIADKMQARDSATLMTQYVFEENDRIHAQTYLRLFSGTNSNDQIEAVSLDLPNAGAITAILPIATIAFRPRSFSSELLTELDSISRKGSLLYERAGVVSPRRALPLDRQNHLSYLVTENAPGGWTKIDGRPLGGSLVGWVVGNRETSSAFRRQFFELEYLEGLIGYQSLRTSQSKQSSWKLDRQFIASRTDAAFRRFLLRAEEVGEAERAYAAAVAMKSSLWLEEGGLQDPTSDLIKAVQQMPREAGLRTLLSMVHMRQCCVDREGKTRTYSSEAERSGWYATLALAFDELRAAVAADPVNEMPLVNLEFFYRYLSSLPENLIPKLEGGRLLPPPPPTGPVVAFVDEPTDLSGKLNNWGGRLLTVGDLSAARIAFSQAIKANSESQGGAAERLASLNNFATLLIRVGRSSDAEMLLKQALNTGAQLGYDHQLTVSTLGNLSGLLALEGRFKEAQQIFDIYRNTNTNQSAAEIRSLLAFYASVYNSAASKEPGSEIRTPVDIARLQELLNEQAKWPAVTFLAATPNSAPAYEASLPSVGTPDGVAGPQTRAAIRALQEKRGITTDGRPTFNLLTELIALQASAEIWTRAAGGAGKAFVTAANEELDHRIAELQRLRGVSRRHD